MAANIAECKSLFGRKALATFQIMVDAKWYNVVDPVAVCDVWASVITEVAESFGIQCSLNNLCSNPLLRMVELFV